MPAHIMDPLNLLEISYKEQAGNTPLEDTEPSKDKSFINWHRNKMYSHR